MEGFSHTTVLYNEVLQLLSPRPGGVYVDGTIGGGGHALGILQASSPDGILLGFDRDAEALAAASRRLSPFEGRVRLFHANFTHLSEILAEESIEAVDGMVLDLGVSSHQLDTPERGFSFQQDAPLDMRMDTASGMTAADLVNTLAEQELERIIRDFGEERWARRIAAAIVTKRREAPVLTTLQLAGIVSRAIPRAKWEARLHPATRTFQAIRIAVNGELESLAKVLGDAVEALAPGGRLAVISFHSLEDRIVKTAFNELAQGCVCLKGVPRCVCGRVPVVKKLTGKPVTAGPGEIANNLRSRSAKLRAVEKL